MEIFSDEKQKLVYLKFSVVSSFNTGETFVCVVYINKYETPYFFGFFKNKNAFKTSFAFVGKNLNLCVCIYNITEVTIWYI